MSKSMPMQLAVLRQPREDEDDVGDEVCVGCAVVLIAQAFSWSDGLCKFAAYELCHFLSYIK
jgi:hypothetical protein